MTAASSMRVAHLSAASPLCADTPFAEARPGAQKAEGRLPMAPRTLADTGLDFSFLLELLVKILFVRGHLRLAELVEHTGLLPGVLDPLLQFMRAQTLCEVIRRGETEGATLYALTEFGRTRAGEFLRRSQYVGAAPVPLAAYLLQVKAQSVGGMGVTRGELAAAFGDLVLDGGVLEQIGAAMNSCGSMFIYGPPGSGKTFLAERLVRLLSGDVAIPHAIVVSGEVIQVFDAMVHRPASVPETGQGGGLNMGQGGDRRWVLCRRPVVMAGAELTLSAVDLELDGKTRYYQAPPQVKANNGLFILDDLGRQLVSAQDLMNRWIQPLDRHFDYLSLHTGQKFQVPFDVMVVFSSNLHPLQLADEAFLRRLGYKIYVGPLDSRRYRAVFEKACAQSGVPFHGESFGRLCQLHDTHRRPMLACIPGDLIAQVRDYARFYGDVPEMSPALIQWAWNNYFVPEYDRASPQERPPKASGTTMDLGDMK